MILPFICFSIAALIGCTSTIEVAQSDPLPQGLNQENKEASELRGLSEWGEKKYKKVLLISQTGKEINVNPEEFEHYWKTFYPFLLEEPTFEFAQQYTIITWDEGNQAYVTQVAEEGIKVGQLFYSHPDMSAFLHWIDTQIGEQYLKNLTTSRILVSANDLSISQRQTSQGMIPQILTILDASTLINGEARIRYPLFPSYQIELELDHEINRTIYVLSPTMIAIRDGDSVWNYQLNDSIFKVLKQVVPIPSASPSKINDLFTASEVRIFEKNRKVLQLHATDGIQENAIIHEIVRILTQGNSVTTEQEFQKDEEEDNVMLEFYFADHTSVIIEVIDQHHFQYQGQTIYYLKDVRTLLQEMIK